MARPQPTGRRGARRSRLPTWIAAVGVWLSVALPAAAADPSAAPSASDGADAGPYPNLEAWLVQTPAPDAVAGSTITVGLTIWDSQQTNFLAMSGLFLKLHPATGKAPPTEAEITRSDVPGLFAADVVVPRGGPGAVEVVVRDQTDLPIHVGGVGPPPAAPLSRLVIAQVRLPSRPAVAGQPIDLSVDVRPLVEWDPPLSLPDRLVVIATLGRGPDLANTEIHLVGSATYAGQITIPKDGDVTLVFAFPGGTSGADDVIPGATSHLQVAAAGGPKAPVVAVPVAESGVPWPLYAGGLGLVLAAGFVIRRVFADL